MEKKKVMASFQTTVEQKEKHQKVAEQRGQSASALINQGADFIAKLDSFTLSVAEKFSEDFSVPLQVVMGNIFLRYVAERDAHTKIYKQTPATGIEFVIDGQSFMTGKRLYRNLRSNFEQGFSQVRREQLRKKIDALEPLLIDTDLPDDRQETYRAMYAELQRELDSLEFIQPAIDSPELEEHLTDQRDYIQKYLENGSEGDD